MSKNTKNNGTQVTNNKKELFTDTNISMKTGHLTRDAEVIGDGKFVKIRFASNKQFETAKGEIETKTDYFNALVSKNLKDAFETAKDFKKGDWIYVKGEDSTKSFDTPEGYKQTASTIFAFKAVLKKKKISETSNQEALNNEPVAS